jgi:hypothetical protein
MIMCLPEVAVPIQQFRHPASAFVKVLKAAPQILAAVTIDISNLCIVFSAFHYAGPLSVQMILEFLDRTIIQNGNRGQFQKRRERQSG